MIRFLRRLACFRPRAPGAAFGLAFALLLTLLTLALPVPVAWAQATTTPRAALHEGFARLAFDWTGQVAFSADIVNDQLVVRFDRAVQGDFKTLLKTLAPRYVAGVSVSEDRRTAAFPLAGGFTVRSFRSGDTVVVDLVDGPAPQQSQPQQPQQQPAPAAAKGAGGGVQVRATEQAGFSRLIFEWPAPVPYQIAKHGDHATIAFARRGSFDLQAMRGVLPTDIQAEEAGQGETSSTVVLALPAGARLRHFSDGRNVVVDVVRPADAQPPRQADGTKPPPLAPPPGQAVSAPAMTPLSPQPGAPKPPREELAQQQPAATRGGAAPGRPAPLPLPEDEAGGPAGGPSVSLSFSWSQPTAAAVFRRAGWLWVVFDRPQELDVKLLRQMGGEALSHIEQLPNKHSTYVRMITQPGYNPSLRREGLLWIVDLARQPLRAKTPLAVETIADTTIGNRLYMPITEAGAVLRVGDPESGEIMTVVPVLPVGTGISPGLEFPEVQVLPSAQGLALVARSDAVDVRSSRKGIDITAPPAGLSVTPENERRLIAAGGNATAAGVFDINAWKRGGPEMYEAGHKAVMSMIAAARPHDRNLARIEAARFFTARGQAAEALGILRVAAADEPGIAESPEFAGVRGAAEFLMGHYDTAYQDLSHPALASLPEAQFWRGAAQAAMDESAKMSEALQQGYGLLKDYPKELRSRIGEIAVNAAIANADDVDARRVLDLMKGDAATPLEKGRLAYLEGNYAQLTHSNDQAFKRWEEAEQGNSRPHRAKAFRNHTELLLKLGKINRKDAIGRLEKLRFAWRSEDFEVPLLKRLADLQLAEADFPGALRSLRAVLNAYPQNKDATATYQQMGQIFERLYLEGAADQMSPVTAIALFDEFRDLTPTGPKGDEMIRRLADRLVKVDLLDRAAELLQHQVGYRLQGVEKARVGAQLALVRLLDHKPDAALEALIGTAVTESLPQDLINQRRHLQARALDDLNRTSESLALLEGDDSPEGRLLRAEMLWRHQNWKDAAQAFESLIAKPERGKGLEPVAARMTLHWATALTLANDDRGLARLRRDYGPAMQMTDLKEAFDFLTSIPGKGIIDYRSVASKIKEAENFQAFMAQYRNRLRQAGLSGIN